jgi:hypothetical protein
MINFSTPFKKIHFSTLMLGMGLILQSWPQARAQQHWEETVFGLDGNVSPRVQSNEILDQDRIEELNAWATEEFLSYLPSSRFFERIAGFIGGQDGTVAPDADVLISLPVIDLGISKKPIGTYSQRSSVVFSEEIIFAYESDSLDEYLRHTAGTAPWQEFSRKCDDAVSTLPYTQEHELSCVLSVPRIDFKRSSGIFIGRDATREPLASRRGTSTVEVPATHAVQVERLTRSVPEPRYGWITLTRGVRYTCVATTVASEIATPISDDDKDFCAEKLLNSNRSSYTMQSSIHRSIDFALDRLVTQRPRP